LPIGGFTWRAVSNPSTPHSPTTSSSLTSYAPTPRIPRSRGTWKRNSDATAAQCPHIAKFADDIAEAAAKEYGIEPNVVEMRSYRDAQDAPTPYAVFAVVYKGRLLADHPISCTRFRNIMGKAR
jgi:hypothetical protein